MTEEADQIGPGRRRRQRHEEHGGEREHGGAGHDQRRRRQRIEPAFDQRVPAGVAGGGEQNGEEDEVCHQRSCNVLFRSIPAKAGIAAILCSWVPPFRRGSDRGHRDHPFAAAGAHSFGPARCILRRARHVGAERLGGVPAPMRVVEEGARDRHLVGLALGDDRLGLRRRQDQPDRTRDDARLLLHPRRDRHVVAGLGRIARVGGDAAGGDADEIDALPLQRLGDGDRVVGREAVRPPVAAGDARAERQLLRHHRAHRARDRQRKAQAVLERAAILVGALVGNRRHEAVRQIAMREMQLDLVEADAQRALRRRHESRAHALHVVFRHLARRLPVLAERDRRSRHGLPRIGAGFQRLAAFPRALRRALAAGMRELDAELGVAHAARLRDHARKRRLVVVAVEAETAVGDAAGTLDMRRLDDHQRGAGMRHHAEMHQVPVIGAAVVAGILAHRRDDEAVRQLETGELDRREQSTAHGGLRLSGEKERLRYQRVWMDFK